MRMNEAIKNTECRPGRQFVHKNGKTYVVHSEDGCFVSMETHKPIFGKFGARTLKNGQPFGPMRDMLIANVVKWL